MKYTPILLIIITVVTIFSCEKTTSQKVVNKPSIEHKIDSLIALMTLEEKIGQTCQRGTSSREKGLSEALKEAVRQGKVGALLNVMNTDNVKELQRIAVEESPHGIPLLFGRDVIHGFKTIFPIPLAQAATFNPALVEKGAHIAAVEAQTSGINWTFAPMIDIARDPRWGRIAESAGEDPYLCSRMTEAYIKGFQGNEKDKITGIAACAKHFAGYGAAEGGRDYNSAYIPDYLLHNVYLRPFKTASDMQCASFMTSFSELNNVPASGNQYLLKEILRDQWNYDGLVVSDWFSIVEMVEHGFAKDEKEAAEKAANAGLDMEMMSTSYEDHLAALIKEGKFSEKQLDEFVRNILRIKFRLGLFDNPTFNDSKDELYSEEHLEAAKQTAIESMVLLKNDKQLLPLSPNYNSIALIGPMLDAPHEQLGTWIFDGDKSSSITPLTSLSKTFKNKSISISKGVEFSRDQSKKGFDEAIKAAKESEIVLFFAGEESILSGEAHSRANIRLPGVQEELISALAQTGKPIVLIVMAGRPITFENILDKVDAVIMAWHPGTMAGPAINDLLTGKTCPSGRLPVSWPKEVGQIPIYYNHSNTGRPAKPDNFVGIDEIPVGAWQSSLGNTSHYLDLGYKPLYPFGFGLSYTHFEYEGFSISKNHVGNNDSLTATITIKNTGNHTGIETPQLYIQDMVGSITRPVKELYGFERVKLKPGESKTIRFTINSNDLSFYGIDKKWRTEAGDFKLWIGKDAEDNRFEATFSLTDR